MSTPVTRNIRFRADSGGTDGGGGCARSARHCATADARWRLASTPKWRMRTKPSAPAAGEAQLAARQVKIGMLCAGFCPFPVPEGTSRPLINALERVGLVQGRTLAWDIGGVVFSEDQITVEAQKLVARRPDLILVWPGNVAAARAAKDATRTIPIVLMAVPDAGRSSCVSVLGGIQPGPLERYLREVFGGRGDAGPHRAGQRGLRRRNC
jgi:hypothetical protein